ncbi:MAG TPA: helix-turn-helix transcriptional regulator [Mycobacteriales bacterium]|jgi:transcriptional regulator with XRE-family HTH domain|nr:helix-turn-helix transcriptional regulator [Mycobacteriales bacterium]
MTNDSYADRASTAAGRRGLACAAARYRAVELVAEVLAEQGVTQRELARRLGKSESAVSQVLGGDRNLTLNTLAEYLDALGHRLELHAARCVEGGIKVDLDLLGGAEVLHYGERRRAGSYQLRSAGSGRTVA